MSPRRERPQRRKQRSKSPLRKEVALAGAASLASTDKALLLFNTIASIEDPNFWTSPRKVQVSLLLRRLNGTIITHRDIAQVMRVSEAAVSRYWHYMMERPEAPFRRPGRPSPFDDVFGQVKNFIREETANQRSVTIGVLMEYLADNHSIFVSRRNVWEYTTTHGYACVWGIPTEKDRAVPDTDKLCELYTRGTPRGSERRPPFSRLQC